MNLDEKKSCDSFPFTPQSQCDELLAKPRLFDFQSILQSCIVLFLNLHYR